MSNKSPNVSGIVKHKKKESEQKKRAVLDVLSKLEILDDPVNHPISKAIICQKAGVSKTFLYSHNEELIIPINNAIKKQQQKIRILPAKNSFSKSSKDVLIKSLSEKIKKLENENNKLKNENAILLGKLSKYI